MARQYSNKTARDFGGGIDQRSAPNTVPDTFSEDLQNVTTNSNGFVAKRPGYQGHYGRVPIRIKQISRDGATSEITFTLDDSINIASLSSCPIVVQGKTTQTGTSGDWAATDNVEYYSTTTNTVRTELGASSSPVTVPSTTHGVTGSNDVFITLMDNSANTSSTDWTMFFADRADISSSSTYPVDIEYSTLPSDITAFVGVRDKTTTSGVDYTTADLGLIDSQTATMTIASPCVVTVTAHGLATNDPVQFTTTGTLPTGVTASTTLYVKKINNDTFNLATTAGGADINTTGSQSGTHTISAGDIIITSATTGFTNNNVLVQAMELDSGASEYFRTFPEISLVLSTGTVTVSNTISGASPTTQKVSLSQGAATDIETLSIAAGGTTTTTITGADADWYEVQCWENVSGTLTWMFADTISHDESAETLSVTITNSSASVASFYIFYEAIDLKSSDIVVTDNEGDTSDSYTETAPQLTMWGIPHEGLYSTSGNTDGHVTHLDSYHKETEDRVICGLGGNLFTARTRAEESTDFLIPTTDVDITGTVTSDVDLAPCFDVTDATTTRTRGLVTSDEVASNLALINAVSFVSTGVARYSLTLTNKVGSLSTAISVDADKPDLLTVTGMANDANNGTFTITAVDNTTSAETITVTNALITGDDWDETGAAGEAGIFTDQVTLSANSKFLPSDTFITNIASTEPTVSISDDTVVVLKGITTGLSLGTNLTVYGSRTASVIPVDSTTNFVKGDMCTFASLDQQVRVIGMNVAADVNLHASTAVTGDGTTATVTTASAAAHGLVSGQTVVLLRTGVTAYDGEQTITAITSSSTFQFASTSTSTAAGGVILGKTIEIDESTTVADNVTTNALAVVGRWIPVEVPTTSDGLPVATYVKHLDANEYEAQTTMRSTMVSDNMYFVNYQDEVMKFDGTSLYQTGVFRWQPQLFAQVDTTTGSITASPTIMTSTTDPNGVSKFTGSVSGDAAQFVVGDVVIYSATGTAHTIANVDTTNNIVRVADTFGSGFSSSETITISKRFRYYFRLNAIDANKNIVASAATGSEDFYIDMGASAAQIKIRMMGFPVWGIYDYDKIELEVYRTKSNTTAPFYRVGTKDVSFVAGDGYIDFTDSVNDDTLGAKDLDPVNTALLGVELGTGWSQPIRAKYVTSADNRLITANLKDYPELDIVIRSDEGVGAVTAANLSGKIFEFHRDSATSGAQTTDMDSDISYEFMTSGEVTIDPANDIANTSSTFTVTETSHGLVVGDWVYMFHAAAGTVNSLTYAGWWQIVSKNDNDFTVNANMNVAAGAADVDRYIAPTTSLDVPVWLGTDGNLNQVDAGTVNEFTAMIRLANAINASMRMTDTAISGQTTFVPWLTAAAGSEYSIGQLIVRQPKVESTTIEVLLPAATTGATYYVGGLLKAAAAEVAATTKIMGSRVAVSYQNYPEIFDNPFGDGSGTGIIDVNSSDGEEITGVIPFFGSSVFGAGQVESLVVVFKTNSIYLLDIATGNLSKIQSRGLGCTAPFSIASTRDGIMFANNSGMYRLNRDQSISYIGRNMERLFRDSVNRDQLAVMQGHHYGVGGQYKLSVPFGTSQTTNNRVFVYDHQREAEGKPGAWSQYTNHPATGWANLGNDAFFSTTAGEVFSIRRTGNSSDFRDDASAVAEMVIILGAADFGQAGVRKVIQSVVSHFHVRSTSMAGTELLSSIDLDGDFTSSGTFAFTKSGNDKVKTARSALTTRKFVYLQLKYINSTKDEEVILTGVDYRVGLLSDRGVVERIETS